MKDVLITAIEEVASLAPKDKQKMGGGKLYTMVHARVEAFRKNYGAQSNIVTEILVNDMKMVCMKATIYIKDDGEWIPVATGHAEEFRGQGMVNKTSALENCETSAIGRALASLGLHGGEFASSFEVDNSINNKSEATDNYICVGSKGDINGTAPTPDTWFAMFSIMVSRPESKTCQTIYKNNIETVHRAFDDALAKNQNETVDGLSQVMTAYGDDYANDKAQASA